LKQNDTLLVSCDHLYKQIIHACGRTFNNIQMPFTLWHVHEEIVGSKVDVMNNFSKVLMEICVGQVLQIVKGILGNVSFPMEISCKDLKNSLNLIKFWVCVVYY